MLGALYHRWIWYEDPGMYSFRQISFEISIFRENIDFILYVVLYSDFSPITIRNYSETGYPI